MKKLLSFLLTFLAFFVATAPLSAQTVWDGTADVSWYDDSQTSFDISTPEQLAGVASLVNSGNSFSGKMLNLTSDLWLNNTGDFTNNWVPIGGGSPTAESTSSGNAFKGNFNGHGFTIYNLYCEKTNYFHAGLFGCVENPCTIDSLVMVNPTVKACGMMGTITGFVRGSGDVYIRYCMVINTNIVGTPAGAPGSPSAGHNNNGGIVGATYPNSSNTYIQNCGVTGKMSGRYIGGIGGNAERAYLTNCYFAGDLTPLNGNFGGMTTHGGERTNCYSYVNQLNNQSQSSASSHGTSVTQAKMQSDSMITLLGDAFMMDPGINNGYPILSFMRGVAPMTAQICSGESIQLTAFGYDSQTWNTGETSTVITINPTTTTAYTVTGNLNGTSSTAYSNITVFPNSVVNATITASSDGTVHGFVSPETATASCGTPENVTFTVYPDDHWRVASIYMNGTQVYGEQTYGPFSFSVLSEEIISEVVINLTDAPTCTHVNNLSLSNVNGTNATVTWTVHTTGELSEYHVILREVTSGSETEYTTTDLSILLSGLTENTAYQVGVYTFCTDGYGSDTVSVNFMTPCNSPIPVTVGSGTATSQGGYFPLQTYYKYSYTQQIIPASQLNNEAQSFSALAFQYFYSTSYTRDVDIYLAHVPTTMNLTSAWILPSEDNDIVFTQVFSGQVTLNNSGTGYWFEFPFSQSFDYNGTDNILVAVLDHTGSFSGSADKFYTHNDANTANMSRYVYRDASTYDPFSPDAPGTVSSNVNNMRFIYCDMSSCIRPNTVEVNNVDASSAEISWFNPNSTQDAEIEYMANGDDDWTSTGSVSGSPYTLSGLDANTVYQVRVRALCSGNEQSIWTEPVSFRTECEAIWELPYTQNFDSDTYGSGNDIYVHCWDRYASNPSEPVFVYTTSAAHSSPRCLKFSDGANITNIAIMPKVDESISLNELQLSFWLRRTENSNVVFELGVMTDKSDPTTFEVLDTMSLGPWALIEYSLANYTGNGHYIAFRVTKGNGSDYIRVDDVTLDYIPTCAHPIDLVVDAVTSETADIHWSDPGTASTWHVEYGPAGYTPGEGTMETVYDSSHTIYNLTPNTEYDVYVWSDCGGGLVSTTIDASFRTDCGPIMELPYSEDFETGIYSTSQENYILCWSRYASDPTHYVYVPNNSYAHSGTHFLDFHHTTNCYNIAITPELDQSFDVSTLMVNFWACRTGSSGTLEVGVMTDKDADSTFVPIDTIDLSMMSTYAYKEQFVSLSSYQGDGKYIAFRVSNAASCGYYIDDVLIDYEPACSPINDLTVSEITGSSAMVSWNDGPFGTIDSYTIEYSEAGMENWQTLDNITDNPYLLGGLDFSTDYDLRVKPNCDNLSSGDWVTTSFRTKCLVGGDFTIGDGTATNSYLPSYSLYNYSYTQQLFLASEIGSPRSIESVTFEKVAGSVDRTFKIYLMHTSATSGADWIDASTATLVFDTVQSLQNGLNTFTFSQPFEYNGTDNLLLIVLDMTGSWASGNTWRTHTAPFTASRYIYQDASAYSTSAVPSSGNGGSTSSRNNVIFGAACDNSTCAAPFITVTNPTSDGATVNWVAGYQESAWELGYALASDTNWISLGTVTSMSEVLTGLLPNTSYKVHMRSICSGSEYSYWVEAGFTTACGAFTVTQDDPWTEDFETNTTMACFETPVTYTNSSGNTYPKMLLNYSLAAHSGGNSAEFKGDYNMLVLPEFTNDIHDLRMSFWATTWGVTTTAVVGVLPDLSDPTSFEELGDAGIPGPRGSSGSTGNGNYMGPFDFNNVQATSGRIALLFTGTTASDAGWNLDDFTVELIPSCSAPAHTSVTVNNVTENSAEISFTDEDASHSAWAIYYGVTGTSTDTWNVQNVTSTTGNILTGLSANTNYSAYVVTLCNGVPGDDQTNTVTFTTTTTPALLPYTTDFEDTIEDQQWVFVNGTQTNQWYIGTPTDAASDVNTTIGGSNGLYVSNDGGVSNAYGITTSKVYAYRDIFVPDGTTDLVLSFDWKAQGSSAHYHFLRVYWLDPSVNLTPGNNPPGYDISGQPEGEHWLAQQNTWQHQEMVISANQFAGMGNGDRIYRLVFHWRNESYSVSNPPAAVDNVELRVVTCATPTNVFVDNVGTNNATVYWSGSADSYGVTITSATGTDYQTTTNNSLMLNGLTPNTPYQVTVRAFCGTDSSMLSQTVSFTTQEQSQITDPTVATNAATTVTQHEATLHATITNPDNVTIATKGFEWKATTGSTYTQMAGAGSGSTFSGLLDGLNPSTSYTFRAFIIFNGTTVYGDEMTFTTLPDDTPEPCDAPTGLHTTAIHNESLELAWDNANVDGWNVQWRVGTGTWSSAHTTANSYTITGLTGLTTYEIQVQADCGNNNLSDWSASITAQTTNVGIENFTENNVTLFPNPAKEYVDIRIDGDVNVTNMEIFDVYGKLINTVNVIDNPTRINVNGLANGMYFVRVTTDKGAVTKTFVKK